MIQNYADLTIKQYLQCKLIAELEPDPIIRKCKMLAEVSGKSLDHIESLPLNELYEKFKQLDQLNSIPSDNKVSMKIKVGGKKFNVKWKQQYLTAEQYIDATHFCKDPNKIEQNIHNILASISVECGLFSEKTYSGDKHKEVADLFYNELKIKQAYPILVFFCKYYKILADNMQSYLATEMEARISEAVSVLEKNGDGLPQSTILQITTELNGITFSK